LPKVALNTPGVDSLEQEVDGKGYTGDENEDKHREAEGHGVESAKSLWVKM
jgi:hypothetical protein